MSSAHAQSETSVERWVADPSRSTVEFEVEHLWGLHAVRGCFRSFEGGYLVGPGGSELELTIDAGSVDTGCGVRDRHLRSADFFGVEEHPQVRFTSSRVTGLGSGRVHVSGELEAAGKRVPVAFDALVRLVEGDVEIEATAMVDQGLFGMSDRPFGNVRRPTTVRVSSRLVRVPAGVEGGSGGVVRGSALAAARGRVGSSDRMKGEGNG